MHEKRRDNVVRATLGRFDEGRRPVVDQQARDYSSVVKVDHFNLRHINKYTSIYYFFEP